MIKMQQGETAGDVGVISDECRESYKTGRV